ncbi:MULTISPECIES: F0F1 ATP synthase subunit delta [Romboutsia]|uniref:ATP synthase subunit delta n=2 Tax=Romboutsia TaxID=1501226 RepID=A0A2P2BRK8_9FIRM|nr:MULTISPECIES: F0F1 ATP synthase subunit delta [Romboutsia]MCH1958710.1 F0F1 ATP synthase subunit delta [Romboutsia hominis]MCH1970626.1 F0F1 ATP synthase subunit delta [Romboutsia hominis]MDB8789944.1 F0F1 ATP synthase subunit delta [Romboutsia sp. 1001216sp1]MDB8797288.1 F0F1 ATP synthase subunit delta [Romboutsia sp. 1001216sp1]MDB8800164.1 F0F1 ATP synthase subunit delta [Romboutsia sp. 1001216sp1]
MMNVVASRYAEALFQVGEETNTTASLNEELVAVVNILKSNEDFFNVLKSPLVGKGEKKDLLKKVFQNQLSENLSNFLKIMIDKDRVSVIEAVQNSFKALLNEKENVLEGTAITAVPMSQEEIKELELKLSKKYNKNVTLENNVDESILGGVLVRLGNEEIDGTVKTRLAGMKNILSQVIS